MEPTGLITLIAAAKGAATGASLGLASGVLRAWQQVSADRVAQQKAAAVATEDPDALLPPLPMVCLDLPLPPPTESPQRTEASQLSRSERIAGLLRPWRIPSKGKPSRSASPFRGLRLSGGGRTRSRSPAQAQGGRRQRGRSAEELQRRPSGRQLADGQVTSRANCACFSWCGSRSSASSSQSSASSAARRCLPGNAQQQPERPDIKVDKLCAEILGDMEKRLDTKDFVRILRRLVAESRWLQNNPMRRMVPDERRAADVVLDELACFRDYGDYRGRGPLKIEEFDYAPGRTNLKITYTGERDGGIVFAGSHFDVIPSVASAGARERSSSTFCGGGLGAFVRGFRQQAPASQDAIGDAHGPRHGNSDPATLKVCGDRLYGRGTSACYGHIALLTQLMTRLAIERPKLSGSIVVIIFAAREGGEEGLGADAMLANGALEDVKGWPFFWLDVSDSLKPCCGSLGSVSWELKAKGLQSHSGEPHKGINSIELATEAIEYVQQRFYAKFPAKAEEPLYGFATGSTMKPTRIQAAPWRSNPSLICDEASVHGDIRVTPFYDIHEVMEDVECFVRTFNRDVLTGRGRGAWSRYAVQQADADPEVAGNEGDGAGLTRGHVKIIFGDRPSFSSSTEAGQELREHVVQRRQRRFELARDLEGIAINRRSTGRKLLADALCKVRYMGHESIPDFSVTASIPHVRRYQRAGFDVQICGFGVPAFRRPTNEDEYCMLSDMMDGFEVVLRLICLNERTLRPSAERSMQEVQSDEAAVLPTVPNERGCSTNGEADEAVPEDTPTICTLQAEPPPAGKALEIQLESMVEPVTDSKDAASVPCQPTPEQSPLVWADSVDQGPATPSFFQHVSEARGSSKAQTPEGATERPSGSDGPRLETPAELMAIPVLSVPEEDDTLPQTRLLKNQERRRKRQGHRHWRQGSEASSSPSQSGPATSVEVPRAAASDTPRAAAPRYGSRSPRASCIAEPPASSGQPVTKSPSAPTTSTSPKPDRRSHGRNDDSPGGSSGKSFPTPESAPTPEAAVSELAKEALARLAPLQGRLRSNSDGPSSAGRHRLQNPSPLSFNGGLHVGTAVESLVSPVQSQLRSPPLDCKDLQSKDTESMAALSLPEHFAEDGQDDDSSTEDRPPSAERPDATEASGFPDRCRAETEVPKPGQAPLRRHSDTQQGRLCRFIDSQLGLAKAKQEVSKSQPMPGSFGPLMLRHGHRPRHRSASVSASRRTSKEEAFEQAAAVPECDTLGPGPGVEPIVEPRDEDAAAPSHGTLEQVASENFEVSAEQQQQQLQMVTLEEPEDDFNADVQTGQADADFPVPQPQAPPEDTVRAPAKPVNAGLNALLALARTVPATPTRSSSTTAGSVATPDCPSPGQQESKTAARGRLASGRLDVPVSTSLHGTPNGRASRGEHIRRTPNGRLPPPVKGRALRKGT
eukprot:TRINITY_DN11865_c0_g1_i2.p1 TRINITY_DN11865_c0_g1~~TRINITY_DN11865_c0_g1_i2.p1  ORF type:complete len:1433 (-),score=233.59 TRINITY_DN11865_c0_g1_i2:227-4525(-)